MISAVALEVVGGAWYITTSKATVVGEVLRLWRGCGVHSDGGIVGGGTPHAAGGCPWGRRRKPEDGKAWD